MRLETTGKLKVVIDTNTIISAPFSDESNPARIFELLLLEEIINFTSAAIIAEIKEVFARDKIKRNIAEEKIRFIIESYLKYSKQVTPLIKLNVITEDPEDNIILECAETARVNYIISGNDHLKNLKSYKGIKIVSPKTFIEIYISSLDANSE